MSNRHWVKGVVRVGLSVSLGLAVAPASLAGGGRSEEALAALERAAHMPGEVLVQWKAGASESQKAAARGRVGGE